MRNHFRIEMPWWRAARTSPFAVLAIAVTVSACGSGGSPHPAAPQYVLPVRVSAAQMARLALATTFGRLPNAPQDPNPFQPDTGVVLHPTVTQVVYADPGGPAVARLPITELRSQTWVPVVQTKTGWDRILLPTRPNHSTGWIFVARGGLQIAYSAYRIQVNLTSYQLAIFDGRRVLGSWTVAIGSPGTPTPAGRTFLLASIAPVQRTYSPLILPLGVHSATVNTFGGGPGTVALHGWPNSAVFGHAVTHGCVRVPAAALRVLSRIPLGSSVVITS
jgi:lipoprotein-anchoring transpeptidase ErfK/SrfK